MRPLPKRGRPGSSPRMRGTGHPGIRAGAAQRFIPAHAGNRPSSPPAPRPPAVHPRACGEQLDTTMMPNPGNGSSPRMRGTDDPRLTRSAVLRFIPAHAGNRTAPGTMPRASSVHPRACGEQPASIRWTCQSAGSSPRMRGTVSYPAGGSVMPRFIPAHAGNRAARSSPPGAATVHPRACGEQA